MYNNPPNLFGGVASIFVVLVIIGVLGGLALGNTDLLNFKTNPTRAQILKEQSDLELRKKAFDFEQYQQLEKAKTQNALEIQNAQKEAKEQMQYVWVDTVRFASFAGVVVITFVILTCIFLFAAKVKAGFRQIEAHPQIKPACSWQNQEARARQIELARKRERDLRAAHQ